MRPRFCPRGPHPPQGIRPMAIPNSMRGGFSTRGSHYGMGHMPPPPPPPYSGMQTSMMYPPGIGRMGQAPQPMMPRMRPPMIPSMPRPRGQRGMRRPQKSFHGNRSNNDIVKKKQLKFGSFYSSRPWVNDELRNEIAKKEQLFQQAKTFNKPEDWNSFKEQKDKCVRMYSALKLQYIGQHPEEMIAESEDDEIDFVEEATSNEFICESCDREFNSEESYNEHMAEHQTCGIDGCKFTGHQLLVLAHIKVQHSTGLYEKIRNISTPEDIAKWRNERKMNYPSKANIEARYKQQQEMLKRGERIKPKNERFAKKNVKKVLNKKKRKSRRKHNEPKASSVSLINESADWNGTMFPFRGTKFALDENDDDMSKSIISDDEWDISPKQVNKPPKLNNALGALMGAYDSENESDNSIAHEKCVEPKNDETDAEETKILKLPVDIPDRATDLQIDRFASRKRTLLRDNCTIPPKKIQKSRKEIVNRVVQRKPTLLQKLLDKEIRHERNAILQCVRYIVDNNFFTKR